MYFIAISYVEAVASPKAVAANLNLNILLTVVIDGSWTTGLAVVEEVIDNACPA